MEKQCPTVLSMHVSLCLFLVTFLVTPKLAVHFV